MRAEAFARRPLPSPRQLLQLGPVRWHDVDYARAARVAVGVIVPMAAGEATGHLTDGVFAALGSFPAGFVSFQGVTKSRVRAVVLTSAGMCVATFVGGVFARYEPWAIVGAVAALAYLAGLSVSLGRRLSSAALQPAITLEIAVSVPMAPAAAASRAGFVLAGGLLQGALVVSTWVLRPGKRELSALSATYSGLAAYSRSVAVGSGSAPPAEPFPASALLDDPNPLIPGTERSALADLLEQAERARAALAALAGEGPAGGADLQAFVLEASACLEDIASLLSCHPVERPAALRALSARVATLSPPARAGWRWAGEALSGQLRAVVRILASLGWAGGVAPLEPQAGAAVRAQTATVSTLSSMLANMTPTTEAGRHALRLSATAATAQAVGLAGGLPEGRWAVLTVLIVLKPDYASTVYRSVQRAVGTVLGAGLGIALAEIAHLGQGELVAVIAVCVAAAYALFDVNYLLYSVLLTSYIVVLLDLLGIGAFASGLDRLDETAIGSAFAIVAFLAWPTWEGVGAGEKFARLMEAHRAYLTSLAAQLPALACSTQPFRAATGAPLREVRRLQLAARRARNEAEGSVTRLFDEPRRPPFTPELAQSLLASMARFARAELALHGLIDLRSRGGAGRAPASAASAGGTPAGAPAPARDFALPAGSCPCAGAAGALGESLENALAVLRDALQLHQPPAELGFPGLRAQHSAFVEACQDQSDIAPLVVVTDAMVDALDSLSALAGTSFGA
jgi:uncharacterized membrane protein YccC